MSGGSAGGPDKFLNHELAVLVLEIKQVLSPHRRRDAVGNAKTRQFGHKGVKVAICISWGLAVDGLEGRFGALFLEFLLHAPDHRQCFIPGPELGRAHRKCHRDQSEYDRQNRNNTRHLISPETGPDARIGVNEVDCQKHFAAIFSWGENGGEVLDRSCARAGRRRMRRIFG